MRQAAVQRQQMIRLLTRVFAFICSVCPICLARRRWPASLFGQITARIERFCPFCRAYMSLHGQGVAPRKHDGRGSCTSSLLAVLTTISALVISGCGRQVQEAKPAEALVVFAPWSLEKRLRRIFEEHQAKHPDVRFHLVTGTPGSLVKRVQGGQAPDVYVSMGPSEIEALRNMGLLREGSEREILRQRMVLVCSEDMKELVGAVEDLAKPEVRKVGIGRPSLTAGTCARDALRKCGVLGVVEAKSQESPLRSLLAGEVDAAIVYEECCYEEDLLVGKRVLLPGVVAVQVLPDALCPEFPVSAVALKGQGQPQAAIQFVEFLAGQQARDILNRRGPGACPLCGDGTCPLPVRRQPGAIDE